MGLWKEIKKTSINTASKKRKNKAELNGSGSLKVKKCSRPDTGRI